VRLIARILLTVVVAQSVTRVALARTDHRAPKTTAPAAATKIDANIPQKKNRDPADVALDRGIKGICRGC
jgi:hypothetical protein